MYCSKCGLRYKGQQLCACSPKWELGGGEKRQIEHHMGYVHVGKSNLFVAKDVLKATKKASKKVRFACARYAIKCHADNRNRYNQVMTGKF